MLFAESKDVKEIERLLRGKGSPTPENVQKLIEIDPTFAPAYATLAMLRDEAGDKEEAESLAWKALSLWPCSYHIYKTAAVLRLARYEVEDSLSRRLQHLATWKVAFLEKVPKPIADEYKEDLQGLNARDPRTYEMLATGEDIRIKDSPHPPEVEERLRPYILLNELERDAPTGVAHETMTGIIDRAAECMPILRAALRQWARETEAPSDDAALMIIARLGEIGDKEVLEELIELAGDTGVFLHVHWAIHRLADRNPNEALAVFCAAMKSADLGTLCALAEHMYLLPPTFGLKDALIALLDHFDEYRVDEEAGHLLLTVISALSKLGEKQRANTIFAAHQALLGKKDRAWIRDVLAGNTEFTPLLPGAGIVGLEVEDVVVERVLIDAEEDDGEGAEDSDDEPAHPTPGRNEPCWCGSGKKYKKCHLTEDEEAAWARADASED
jgi:hypothetical protein